MQKQIDETSTIIFVCKDFVESEKCILGDEICGEIAPLLTNADVKLLEEYRNTLFELSTIYKKLQKYPAYFECFYNSEVISDEDALEYHIHSFFADVYAYKERLKGLIGRIKNQIPSENKADRDELSELNSIIEGNFDQMTSIRGKHTHPNAGIGWYMEDGTLKMKNFKSTISLLNSDGIKDTVNWTYVKEKLKKEELEAIEELAKSKETLVKNSDGVLKMIQRTTEGILEIISFAMYKTANINEAAEVLEARMLKK